MIYIVIGVSGVGKTTIGQALAKTLALPFYDADDFHPAANVNKMKNGIPLNDDDRAPWLNELATQIINWQAKQGAVLACSALKEKYRQTLQVIDQSQLEFIFLHADPALILKRLQARQNHYMDPALLDSQFEALEQPEYGIHIKVDQSPEQILTAILQQLN